MKKRGFMLGKDGLTWFDSAIFSHMSHLSGTTPGTVGVVHAVAMFGRPLKWWRVCQRCLYTHMFGCMGFEYQEFIEPRGFRFASVPCIQD